MIFSFTSRTYKQSYARWTRKISTPSAQGRIILLESEKIFAKRNLSNKWILSQSKKRKTPMRSLDELLIFTNLTFYKSKRNLTIIILFSISFFPLTNAKRAQIFVTISHFIQLVSLLSLSKRCYNRAIWFVVQFPHCSTRMIWIRPTISMSIDLSSISTWYDSTALLISDVGYLFDVRWIWPRGDGS